MHIRDTIIREDRLSPTTSGFVLTLFIAVLAVWMTHDAHVNILIPILIVFAGTPNRLVQSVVICLDA